MPFVPLPLVLGLFYLLPHCLLPPCLPISLASALCLLLSAVVPSVREVSVLFYEVFFKVFAMEHARAGKLLTDTAFIFFPNYVLTLYLEHGLRKGVLLCMLLLSLDVLLGLMF